MAVLDQRVTQTFEVRIAMGRITTYGALTGPTARKDFVDAEPLAMAANSDAQRELMQAQDPVGSLEGRNKRGHDGGTTEARVPVSRSARP